MTVAESTSDSATDYSEMTVTELKAICKERGITGYSSLTKAELVALLEESDS